ncbi:MAG: hypothetical protein N2258_08965 [Brevinematales bacterium]|nr:hypothetical protein [Brevinematales bacterium]
MERKPYFTEIEGERIIFLDYTNITPDEIPIFNQAIKEFLLNCEECKEGEMFFLADSTGLKYTLRTIRDFTSLSKVTGKYSKATAIYGMTLEIKKLYNAALALAGRSKEQIQIFETKTEAVGWLSRRISEEREKKRKLFE